MAQGIPRERKAAATATEEPLFHEVLTPAIGTSTYWAKVQNGKGTTGKSVAVFLGHDLPEVADGCPPIEVIVRFKRD